MLPSFDGSTLVERETGRDDETSQGGSRSRSLRLVKSTRQLNSITFENNAQNVIPVHHNTILYAYTTASAHVAQPVVSAEWDVSIGCARS